MSFSGDRDSGNAVPEDRDQAQPKGMVENAMCYRGRSRTMIEQTIKRLQSDAASLQALLDTLPAELSPQADAALYGIVQRSRVGLS